MEGLWSSSTASSAGGLIARAAALSRAGRFGEAERQCRQALEEQPGEPTALHLLGVCLLHRGRYAEAEQALAACLQMQPGEPAALANRGIALQGLGRLEDALQHYARSLATTPEQPATLNMQGLALLELKRFDEALQSFDRALNIAPQFAEAWCSRANALIQMRQYDLALMSLDRAQALRPAYGEALSNRSIALNLLGRHTEALGAAEQALDLLPGRAAVHRNLADALIGLGRVEEALCHYDRAVALDPANLDLVAGRADLYSRLGRDAEAAAENARVLEELQRRREELLQERLHAASDDAVRWSLAELAFQRGQLLADIGKARAAVEAFAEATDWRPDHVHAHWSEGLERLRIGDLEAGWRKYEWRRSKPDFRAVIRQFAVRDWTGEEDPRGLRILLHAEQGLGDTLQFCRYAPLLAQRGADVVLAVHPPLKRLMQSLGVAVIADGETLPEVDRHCPVMSLPFAFRTSLATVPAAVPYLYAEPSRVRHWADVLGHRAAPRIGVTWAGNPRHASDSARSFPVELLAPLLALPAEFVSLAKDVRERDHEALARLPMRRLGEQLGDFADTAALLENLDLVVTVDTSVAHLAGALARPVWVLLAARPDFRWMEERDDSPWYPTARLFRQHVRDDWLGVIERIAAELAALLATARADDDPSRSGGER